MHNHHCVCTHEHVKYCNHCNTVYCLNCNEEWTRKYTWSYSTTPNWGQYGYLSGVTSASAQCNTPSTETKCTHS